MDAALKATIFQDKLLEMAVFFVQYLGALKNYKSYLLSYVIHKFFEEKHMQWMQS